MTTTSLKLPQDIKRLAAAEAKRRGVTPHAFMVDTIKTAVMAAEKRARFVADAVAARNESVKTGLGQDAHEVHDYIRASAQGGSTDRPQERHWRD